jgi:hypothetical protein
MMINKLPFLDLMKIILIFLFGRALLCNITSLNKPSMGKNDNYEF